MSWAPSIKSWFSTQGKTLEPQGLGVPWAFPAGGGGGPYQVGQNAKG